jgi:hydrogenase maturation protein HypF
LGELDEALTWEAFLAADADYAALFDHVPALVACDPHPGYRATHHAHGRGLPVVEVQHHHAHMAACMSENGWPLSGGPVAGIVLDGVGLGPDGTIWGGELLLGDYLGVARRGWLRPVAMPGGDRASREPWRNALAQLDAAGLGHLADEMFGAQPLAMLRQAVRAGVNAPLTSSAGRLFDAFAAVQGFAGAQTYEGEAAMALEARAALGDVGAYPLGGVEGVIETAPLWQAWAQDRAAGVAAEVMAARFHAGLAQGFAGRARTLVERGEAQAVALSGGCFQNARLLDLTLAALGGLPVLIHRRTPANDGGLALGQAVVAAARAVSG